MTLTTFRELIHIVPFHWERQTHTGTHTQTAPCVLIQNTHFHQPTIRHSYRRIAYTTITPHAPNDDDDALICFHRNHTQTFAH